MHHCCIKMCCLCSCIFIQLPLFIRISVMQSLSGKPRDVERTNDLTNVVKYERSYNIQEICVGGNNRVIVVSNSRHCLVSTKPLSRPVLIYSKKSLHLALFKENYFLKLKLLYDCHISIQGEESTTSIAMVPTAVIKQWHHSMQPLDLREKDPFTPGIFVYKSCLES